jgi:hypothetical protein
MNLLAVVAVVFMVGICLLRILQSNDYTHQLR